MKTQLFLLMVFALSFSVQGQRITDADFIAPITDGYAAVKQGEQWGFMDDEGNMAVSFRSDLVANPSGTTKTDIGVASMEYPLMQEERTIIKKKKDGITYYGFIDAEGNTVIAPEYLNVSGFKDGYALALKVTEEELGKNTALGKRMIRYYYNVVLLDRAGNITQFLCGPFPISLSKEKLKEAPPIVAKDLAENLIAVQTPENKWEVITIE